ncbi:type II toxin-antitoxin system PemK/MazF family toxin [Fructilactobacillus sanfranciscensis]|uniref:type II toxin-antitoxin system PemK/MazF family toxin n=1 Tax=Fructilactobacillus sanfranciscensis TaxID=1625 RepID=UPI0013CFBA69|nr:type II toxin-antitoxin system PemK/MazF family toxin [Fructilactobacillus sanfranciscensis]NDR77254.1 type II toxin-antitoxin system PemK/MazF family toxin [Fructilactobacillus sanfranciscensis]
MTDEYIPKQTDIIYLDFDPQSGLEIKKRRPALVLSKGDYSERTGLVAVSPITHGQKNHVTSITVKGKEIDGYVNALQFYTFDFRTRHAQYVEKISNRFFIKVMNVIRQIF